VVGGVVVLCITVIAVVFILRRGRNKINHVQGPLAVRGSSTDLPEKYEGPPPPISGVGAPEYGAHANIHSTSGSPPADSPVPVYELGVRQQSHRKELEA
jgi:hypothetical protein